MSWLKNRSATRPIASMGGVSEANRLHDIALLKDCCENRTPAVVLLAGDRPGLAYQARFFELGNDEITLDLVLEEHLDQAVDIFSPDSFCCVAFTCESHAHVFLSSIAKYVPEKRKASQLARLVVAQPHLVAEVEARTAFRVPVSRNSGLQVRVTLKDRQLQPEPVDISLTGMLLSFPSDQDPSLTSGQRIDVVLQLGDQELSLAGVVVPRGGAGLYGLYFPDVLRGSQISPPAALRAMLGDLEKLWIRGVQG